MARAPSVGSASPEKRLLARLRRAEADIERAFRRRNEAFYEAAQAGMTRREIAAATGLALGTVQNAIEAARVLREGPRPVTYERACEHCGRPFQTTTAAKRFCSVRCKDSAWWAENRKTRPSGL